MSQAKTVRSVKLRSTYNGSDKVFILTLVEVEGGYLVNTAHGKTNKYPDRLKVETKTEQPVDLATATKTFEAVEKDKRNGKSHYQTWVPEGEGGEGAEEAAMEPLTVTTREASGAITMNLSEFKTPEQRQAALDDPNYAVQIKYDEEFLKVIVRDGMVIGSTKSGYVTAVPAGVAAELLALGVDGEYDGECVDNHLYMFDMPSYDGANLATTPYKERYAKMALLKIAGKSVHIAKMSGTSRAEKEAFIDRVRSSKGEGVVFKNLNAGYVAGVSPDMIKDKFTHSATLLVLRHNTTARSIVLGSLDASGAIVEMSSLQVPPKVTVTTDDLVEVEYLYAYPSHKLAQGQLKKIRRDEERHKCLLSQLHYKVPFNHADHATPTV